MVNETELKSCEICGATIYPEHIHSGRAAIVDEKLLCPICVNEKKSESQAPLSAADGDQGVALVDDSEMEKSERKVIRAFGGVGGVKVDETKLSRSLQKTGAGATRIKIFHTKMNDGAVEFLSQTINEWIDHNPDVEIKAVQTTVGIWEGKHAEPNLILTVWY